eukprot:symbB.v1.2.001558.t1/scaffold70.1/size352959/8
MVFLRATVLALALYITQGTCDGCDGEDAVLLQQERKVPKEVKGRKVSKSARKHKLQALETHPAKTGTKEKVAEDPDQVDLEDDLKGYNFEAYCREFGKKYSGEEMIKREEAFSKSLAIVKAHNARASTFRLGINEFTDWYDEELKGLRGLAKDRRKSGAKSKAFHKGDDEDDKMPESWDWRDQGDYSTPVKNQGHCGSCWAFAATAVIESHVAINAGFVSVLGPQMIVSCAKNPRQCGGTGGCDGATAQIAFDFVKNNSLTYAEVIAYSSFWGGNGECTSNEKNLHDTTTMVGRYRKYPVASITGFVTNPTNDYKALIKALVIHGPQAISVDASHWSAYESGIADFCNPDENIDIDHAVVLMGYGEEGGTKFWTIRNSWGTLWGEDGYLRLIRHEDEEGYCGTDHTPSHGSLCADEHVTEQHVCGTCGILFDTSYPTGAGYYNEEENDIGVNR